MTIFCISLLMKVYVIVLPKKKRYLASGDEADILSASAWTVVQSTLVCASFFNSMLRGQR